MSAFHLLECVKVIIICAFVVKVFISVLQAHENLHPSVPQSAGVQALEQCLVDMARRYRDPAVPPFDPSALVAGRYASLAMFLGG